jgi:hypothetical protein
MILFSIIVDAGRAMGYAFNEKGNCFAIKQNRFISVLKLNPERNFLTLIKFFLLFLLFLQQG